MPTAVKNPVTPRQRAYFWRLVKQLSLDDDTRHAACEAVCGTSSTKGMTRYQMARCIDHLAKTAGQKARADWTPGWASRFQVKDILRLAREIKWKRTDGLFRWLRARILTGTRKDTWDGTLSRLTRAEGTAAITGLKKLFAHQETRK